MRHYRFFLYVKGEYYGVVWLNQDDVDLTLIPLNETDYTSKANPMAVYRRDSL